MLKHSAVKAGIINNHVDDGPAGGAASRPTAPPKPRCPHYTRLAALDLAHASGHASHRVDPHLRMDVVASNDELREPMEKLTPMRPPRRSGRHCRCGSIFGVTGR